MQASQHCIEQATNIQAPLLIIQAGNDRIVDNDKQQQFLAAMQPGKGQLITIDGQTTSYYLKAISIVINHLMPFCLISLTRAQYLNRNSGILSQFSLKAEKVGPNISLLFLFKSKIEFLSS